MLFSEISTGVGRARATARPIGDPQPHRIGPVVDLDHRLGRAGMAQHVGDRLLDDAVGVGVHHHRCSDRSASAQDGDGQPGFAAVATSRSRSAGPPGGCPPASDGSSTTRTVLSGSDNAAPLTSRMLRTAAVAFSGSSGSASRATPACREMADTVCASTSCKPPRNCQALLLDLPTCRPFVLAVGAFRLFPDPLAQLPA